MSVLDPNDVIHTARSMGWTYARYDANQGQLVFLERVMRGELFKLHIWCTTGTVGSYLDHPNKGKTQLYRRQVDRSGLVSILNNPRVHTGDGYHERAELDRGEAGGAGQKRQRPTATPRTVGCPGCGKMYSSLGGTVMHFESGRCTSCPGEENARRAAYALARQREQQVGAIGMFTNGTQLLTNGTLMLNGEGETDYAAGYQDGGMNFSCPTCRKGFKTMGAMINHVQSRAQCQQHSGHLALSFR
jgi:hypothetical protein